MIQPFVPGRCAICGATPTVKSHIIPRALAHDLRADAKHLVSGEVDRAGIRYFQSGRWDGHILCQTHENSLSEYDDYGVEFARGAKRILQQCRDGANVFVPNKHPLLLQHFFLALIWKKNLSNQVVKRQCELGPYATKIAGALFCNAAICAPLLLVRSPTSLNGKRVPIAVEPHRTKLSYVNAWKCELGWLAGIVVLDQRGIPQEWRQFDGAEAGDAIIFNLDPVDIQNQPSLSPILKNMGSWRGGSRRA